MKEPSHIHWAKNANNIKAYFLPSRKSIFILSFFTVFIANGEEWEKNLHSNFIGAP
jgi:hypothetical protein